LRTRSQRQERRLAKSVDGKPTAASGAFWSRKGDVRSDDLLVEAKETSKGSYSLSLRVWDKIRREALLDGRLPVLAIQIQDRNLIVLDEEDFLALRAERDLGEG
jgi:hypothetical protein